MEILHQIWNAVSENWTATIALTLSIIALGDRIHRWASAIVHWKGWTIARRSYRSSKRKYQKRRAKNAMFAYLSQKSVRIPIRTYAECLAENSLTSERRTLSVVTPEKPSWLNDYYVATALGALHGEGKIAKAELYELSNTWPPHTETHFFLRPEPGKTIEDQAKEIEDESRCRVEQFCRSWSSCSEEDRYDATEWAETTAPGATTFHTRVTQKPSTPPCARCWERKNNESSIRSLVESITRYDLASTATTEITGVNQEFQEAVIDTCMETQ